MTNWKQLANDSTDKAEESRRQKAAVKAEKEAVKTTVVWENPQKLDQIQKKKSLPASNQQNDQRERKTTNYFGNPVMICDIEQKPEVVIISSSTEEN